MHKQPFFLTVLFASAGGWVLGLVKGFSTSKNWLEGIGLPSPPLLVFFLDIFIFVGGGAYFGTGFYDPKTFQAALAAGLTWPVSLGAFGTTSPKGDQS